MLEKHRLEKLYASGLSMTEIATHFQCSVNTVVYWMSKYQLQRRSMSEAIYLKRNPDGDPFNIKQVLSSEEKVLYGLGIGIYWGEGDKTSKNAVRVANTDPALLKIFIRFLTEICQLKKQKLLYQVICFNDSSSDKVKSYWKEMLNIPEEKFGKIIQIQKQGKGTYKKKSEYGVCIVVVCNQRLKTWIMEEILKQKEVLP